MPRKTVLQLGKGARLARLPLLGPVEDELVREPEQEVGALPRARRHCQAHAVEEIRSPHGVDDGVESYWTASTAPNIIDRLESHSTHRRRVALDGVDTQHP